MTRRAQKRRIQSVAVLLSDAGPPPCSVGIKQGNDRVAVLMLTREASDCTNLRAHSAAAKLLQTHFQHVLPRSFMERRHCSWWTAPGFGHLEGCIIVSCSTTRRPQHHLQIPWPVDESTRKFQATLHGRKVCTGSPYPDTHGSHTGIRVQSRRR